MVKNFIQKMVGTAIVVSFLTACAGHDPNPVMVVQYGDDGLSCKGLQLSMSEAQNEMQRLVGQTNKTGQNVALGVAGAFLLVPWFFMDFKEGEKVEYDAWRQRYNHLALLAEEKHCGMKKVHIPTAQELQRAAEAARKKQKEIINR
ncbi:MAG: hypothetical protein GC185_09540 [Alphaproteobacteria bacterium]|nr:hypothetical protein [Alphaproteobacteria bacterium]